MPERYTQVWGMGFSSISCAYMTFFRSFHGKAFYKIFNPERELYRKRPTQSAPTPLWPVPANIFIYGIQTMPEKHFIGQPI
jgi:hypothetical protein